ncbi:hypothetical protein [Marinibacterium sp. SX1]|uniref:hypothetical protein n=1 Tax=Marinibacterium sp. SX1 TaxID=3388424 RepID=UPI003D1811AD
MAVDFIFLLSPNNSGTTIIGQYLQGQTGGYLPPFGNHEGQMAPAVRDAMRSKPWDPDHKLDWAWIRDEWTKLAEEAGQSLFIECSPPNLLHVDAIREAFGDRARCLFSITSPYAYISSCLYNYSFPPMAAHKMGKRAREWVFKAETQRRFIEQFPDIPRIRYEDFCADPTIVNQALDLDTVTATDLRGKANEAITEIVELSARQFAFLTFAEWDRVNGVLAQHEDLLDFFGYTLRPGRELLTQAAGDPALMHAGILRRTRWDMRKSQKKAAAG